MSGLGAERVEEAVAAMEAAQVERYGALIPEMSPDEAMDALAPLIAGWLAEERAGALRLGAAGALREAADLIAPLSGIGMGARPTRSEVSAWLRDRADRIGGTA